MRSGSVERVTSSAAAVGTIQPSLDVLSVGEDTFLIL